MAKQRTVNPNPPIKGHTLLAEGHSYQLINPITDDYFDEVQGGCWCGAKPDGWPNVSINAVKRWHRQHKAALRDEAD